MIVVQIKTIYILMGDLFMSGGCGEEVCVCVRCSNVNLQHSPSSHWPVVRTQVYPFNQFVQSYTGFVNMKFTPKVMIHYYQD